MTERITLDDLAPTHGALATPSGPSFGHRARHKAPHDWGPRLAAARAGLRRPYMGGQAEPCPDALRPIGRCIRGHCLTTQDWLGVDEGHGLAGISCSRVDPGVQTAKIALVSAEGGRTLAALCSDAGLRVEAGIAVPEGYVASITPDRILVAGHDARGLVHGVQTLRQLLRPVRQSEVDLPELVIQDAPERPGFRGFYMEGSFGVYSLEEMRRLIRDTYSHFKGNALVCELRWSDIQWKSHPEVAPKAKVSLEDVAAIAAYARSLGVDFVPHLNTYGAVQVLLRAHPEIAEYAGWEKDSHNGAFCPNNPASYRLLFDLLQEAVDATKCSMMHIGHDEMVGMARCPICSKIPPEKLFADDINKTAAWLADRNVATMIWGDMLLDSTRWRDDMPCNANKPLHGNLPTHKALGLIDKQVIIGDWRYHGGPTYPTLKHFADAGYRVIGCPFFGIENNARMAAEVSAMGGMGVLETDWGFGSTRSPQANSILGVACAWNSASSRLDDARWKPLPVLAASVRVKDRPSRHLDALCVPLGLEAVANRAMAGGEVSGRFGCDDQCDLSLLPRGKRRMFGVDYLIPEKAVVVGNGAGLPGRIPGITVGRKAASLVFMQVMAVDLPSIWPCQYGQYRIAYADGSAAVVPIDHTNITHWISSVERINPYASYQGDWGYGYTWASTLVWKGCSKTGIPLAIQAHEWINPTPDIPIVSVEMIANEKITGLQIGLIALTAVERTAKVSVGGR